MESMGTRWMLGWYGCTFCDLVCLRIPFFTRLAAPVSNASRLSRFELYRYNCHRFIMKRGLSDIAYRKDGKKGVAEVSRCDDGRADVVDIKLSDIINSARHPRDQRV